MGKARNLKETRKSLPLLRHCHKICTMQNTVLLVSTLKCEEGIVNHLEKENEKNILHHIHTILRKDENIVCVTTTKTERERTIAKKKQVEKMSGPKATNRI